jgi:hypothetical protein
MNVLTNVVPDPLAPLFPVSNPAMLIGPSTRSLNAGIRPRTKLNKNHQDFLLHFFFTHKKKLYTPPVLILAVFLVFDLR